MQKSPSELESSAPPPLSPKIQTENAQQNGKFGPVAAVLVVFLAFLAAPFLAGLFIGYGAKLGGENTADIYSQVDGSVYLQTIYYVLVALFSIGIVWLFLRGRQISLKQIGMSRRPGSKDLFSAVGYYAVYFVLLLAVTAIAAQFVDANQEQQIGFSTASTTEHLVLVFLSLVIIPPIFEEILFRGFLYTGLRQRYRVVTSAIVVSIVFGLLHLQLGKGAPPLWIAMIDTTLLSLLLVHLRERTGAIWAGMLVHGFKNALAFVVLFVVK